MGKILHFSDRKTKLLLGLIILIAAFFRFYNLNWDDGHFFHPDERNIANAVTAIRLFSQMDPKFYAYGGFLIYIYALTANFLVWLFHNPIFAQDWTWINVIGRAYSALFSTLTIIPIYLLGTKLFTKKTALLGAFIYAVTVSSIQTAHFSTTENLLTLLITVITLLSVVFYEKISYKLSLFIGIVLGIAVGTKTTGISFLVVPLLTLGILLTKRKVSIKKFLISLIIIGLSSGITFTLSSPYTFLNFDKFMESMHYENSVVLGTNPVVYTLQFTHTIPYLFQLKNLFWQLGVFAIFAILGAVTSTIHGVKSKKYLFCIFLVFPLMYFLYVGSWFTKFNRYMVPLFPFLILLGSHFLVLIKNKYDYLGKAVIGIVVLCSVLYSFAYLSIYTHPQTRIETSEWIYSHVPRGSFILSEHWDDGQPIPLLSGAPDNYRTMPLAIYDQDNDAKLDYYANYLSQADYITINSRRLYGTLMHLPEKYPLTQKYYQLLFAEKLGYQKVAEFHSYPRLFGITLNDDSSEETFQVYDHPKTFIFKNTHHYSYSQLRTTLSQ